MTTRIITGNRPDVQTHGLIQAELVHELESLFEVEQRIRTIFRVPNEALATHSLIGPGWGEGLYEFRFTWYEVTL